MNLQSQTRGDKIEHRWRMTIHADGCHFFTFAYTCVDCGAGLASITERDFNGDPYSAVWMDPDVWEGEDGGCERCAELRDGAEPEHSVEFYPAGSA
jgi:hypothetical protein